jgi:hypothetical protein
VGVGEITRYDHHALSCPLLEEPVVFRFCRQMNNALPCPQLETCWQSRLPVQDFLRSHYLPESLSQRETLTHNPEPEAVW